MEMKDISLSYLLNSGEDLSLLKDDIQNEESMIILKDDLIYKIIEERLRKSKQEIVNKLFYFNDEYNFELHNYLIENNNFCGYSMKYHEGYEDLTNFIISNVSINERKKVCLELLKKYIDLHKNNFIYTDWHSKNVLFKEDTKVIDLDSMRLTKSANIDARGRRNLLILIKEILTGVDFDFGLEEFLIESEKIEMVEMITDKSIMDFCDFIPLDFETILNEINNYSEERALEEKEKILARCKVL